MARPQLHLITDNRLPVARLLAVIAAAVDSGVDLVQVRDKWATAEALVALTRQVYAVVGGRALVIVNGSPEMARAAGVDGIHLPEGHPDLARARQVLGPAAYIGASVHSVAAALAAEQAGATSITFGHIYPTASHPSDPPRGLKGLREVASAVRLPVIAVGGIDERGILAALAAGAAGIAVISAIIAAEDPSDAARGLRHELEAVTGSMLSTPVTIVGAGRPRKG
ncbi:MAG: thiamine phosphate synthase [Chloroflexota bacterium]